MHRIAVLDTLQHRQVTLDHPLLTGFELQIGQPAHGFGTQIGIIRIKPQKFAIVPDRVLPAGIGVVFLNQHRFLPIQAVDGLDIRIVVPVAKRPQRQTGDHCPGNGIHGESPCVVARS